MALADIFPGIRTLKEQAIAFAANRARQWANNDRSYLGKTLRAVVMLVEGWHAAGQQIARDMVPNPEMSHEGLGKWLFILGLGTGTPGRYGFRDPIPAKGGTAQASGQGNSLAKAGAELLGPDGVTLFKLRADVTLPNVAGTAQAPITVDAITGGTIGNLTPPAVLTWNPAPAGYDPTVTLTGPLAGGKDGETDGEAYERTAVRLQLPPGGGRPQDYGHGGEAWPENALDADGNPILGVRVYGYARHGGYDGTGSPMGVVTKFGTALDRKPSPSELADIPVWVKGTTGKEGKAPIAHGYRVLPPFMPPERALVVQGRVKVSKDLFKFDWPKGSVLGIVVTNWAPGPPAKLQFVGTFPALTNAIDKGLEPRIFIDTRDGTTAKNPTGPIIPVQVRCTAWAFVAGSTELTLEDPLPAGFQAPVALGTEEIYPGGPVVVPVASSMLVKLNELGPHRGDFADENDLWQDTASINNLVTAAENTTDADGITPLLEKVLAGEMRIGVGGNGALNAQDVEATNNTINGPELLYPGRIIVTDGG